MHELVSKEDKLIHIVVHQYYCSMRYNKLHLFGSITVNKTKTAACRFHIYFYFNTYWYTV